MPGLHTHTLINSQVGWEVYKQALERDHNQRNNFRHEPNAPDRYPVIVTSEWRWSRHVWCHHFLDADALARLLGLEEV